MSGRALVLQNNAGEVDQSAVELAHAAYWAQEYVSWVLTYGRDAHAAFIWKCYRGALSWADHYQKYPAEVF